MRLIGKGLKTILFSFLLIASLLLVGCGEIEPEPENVDKFEDVEQLIEEIELLPETIEKEDIKQVQTVEKMYKALTDEKKSISY